MSKLQIEQLTDDVQLEKQAEEAQMEKIAAVVQVVDQASVLTAVGEELFKVAEELENENLQALASDIYQTGERMGAALTKIASESGDAIGESLEIAEDLNKLASIMAEIADDVQNEEFSKMAEAVIEISNELTDEANELMQELEGVEKEAEEKKDGFWSKVKGYATKAKDKAVAGAKYGYGKDAWKATEARELAKGKGFKGGAKALLGTKAGLKSLIRPGVAYGTVAAALAGAGYAVKKHSDKK